MIFSWPWKKSQGLHPESLWSVAVNEAAIQVTDPDGLTCVAPFADLHVVLIETNDSGPWGADFWWILDGSSGVMAHWPEGATGEQAALNVLQALPGFDHDKLTQAIRSTSNASFIVWKRPRTDR